MNLRSQPIQLHRQVSGRMSFPFVFGRARLFSASHLPTSKSQAFQVVVY